MLPVLLFSLLIFCEVPVILAALNQFSYESNSTKVQGNLDIEVTPEQHTILLLGQRRTIHIYCMSDITEGICVKASLEGHPSHVSIVKVLEQEDVVYFAENTTNVGSTSRGAKAYASVDVLGLRPGRAKLKLELLHSNLTFIGTLLENYEV